VGRSRCVNVRLIHGKSITYEADPIIAPAIIIFDFSELFFSSDVLRIRSAIMTVG